MMLKLLLCILKSNKIGYVPQKDNCVINVLCEQGFEDIFEVRINRISNESYPEQQIGIVVYLKGNKKR